MSAELLKIDHLRVDLISVRGVYHTVRDVSLSLNEGEILGVVGESGCGKTMTAKSILRLHDEKRTFYRGDIHLYRDGREENILTMDKKRLGTLRGREIAMVFQDPMTTLNPLLTVGEQIMESLRYHLHMDKEAAKKRAVELLEMVGIHPGDKRMRQYPFEFSGGMLQRASIAMALACNPRLLIADEPTTALDVTMQAQILDLLQDLQKKLGMSILLITHNFGVVAEICDRVAVMYAGQIVESGEVHEIFHHPSHPYTKDLINGIPKTGRKEKYLVTIPGTPPQLNQEITGCAYAQRCSQAEDQCCRQEPETVRLSAAHTSKCHQNLKTEKVG